VETSRASVANLPVIVVADDLIWSSRLRAAVERAGTTALGARSALELSASLHSAPAGSAVIVDLNGRAYDAIEAVRQAAAQGHRVLAVGQHEDLETRKQALSAGAKRVFSYNKLFTDGPQVVTALLEGTL
jgi:DNA-binding NtrC family response regulator